MQQICRMSLSILRRCGVSLTFRNGRQSTEVCFASELSHRTDASCTPPPPQVNYRESISKSTDITYTHKKQSGGSGQFANISVKFEPGEPGTGFEFVSDIKGGAIPKEYIPGVLKVSTPPLPCRRSILVVHCSICLFTRVTQQYLLDSWHLALYCTKSEGHCSLFVWPVCVQQGSVKGTVP